jgi:replicative DNA helicase
MKRRKLIKRRSIPDLENEKYILAFMIMHHNVADAAYKYYRDGQLKLKYLSPAYKRQYRSVLNFYKKYGIAPRRTIKFIHQGEKAKLRSDEIKIDEKLLQVISNEYRAARESYNVSPQFIISEMLPQFIRSKKVNEIKEKIGDSIESGDVAKAEKFISEYNKVSEEPPDSSYGFTAPLTIDYHQDLAKRREAEGSKEVYRFERRLGAIGSLVGPFKRQWLVSVSGSTKSGKSYLVLDIAIDAAIIHKRKVMILCPEMSEDDMIEERINAWISECATSKELSGINYIPEIDCVNNQTGQCLVLKKLPNKKPILYKVGEQYSNISADDKLCKDWIICEKCRGEKRPSKIYRKRFWPAIFWRKHFIKKFNEKRLNRELKNLSVRTVDNLKIKYFPKYSVTIEECFQVIRNYSNKHNWKPDIIIFDYIDILKQSSSNNEMSWQDIDHMWKQASGFAQEMDALVITPDQTTKAGRTHRMLDHTTTPQASQKDHHVNVKLGLSKIEDETMNNICRLNVIYHRHRPFNRNNEVLITQNLTLSQAIIDSVFWYDKKMPPYPIQIPEKTV